MTHFCVPWIEAWKGEHGRRGRKAAGQGSEAGGSGAYGVRWEQFEHRWRKGGAHRPGGRGSFGQGEGPALLVAGEADAVGHTQEVVIALHGVPIQGKGVLVVVALVFFHPEAGLDAPAEARGEIASFMDAVVRDIRRVFRPSAHDR